jgi:hypothetical protein
MLASAAADFQQGTRLQNMALQHFQYRLLIVGAGLRERLVHVRFPRVSRFQMNY